MGGVIYSGSLDSVTRWKRNNGLLHSTKGTGVPETEVSQEAGLGRGTLGIGDAHHKSGAHDRQSSLGCIMGLPTTPGLTCTQETRLRSE